MSDLAEALAGVCDPFSTFEARKAFAARHPIFDQLYCVDTEETDALFEILFDWTLARKSGLYVLGMYRQGKTKAIERAIARLSKTLPFMSFQVFSAEKNPGQKKNGFCRDILLQLGLVVSERTKDCHELLCNAFMRSAAAIGGKVTVLFIDEAQVLTVQQYLFLKEIWNRMRMQGYLLITVLVGQPELVTLRNLTSDSDQGSVLSRFFVKPYSFGGIKSQESLEALLAKYDKALFFPESSDWSHARFFVQQGFDGGWRLESEGPRLWSELLTYTGADARSVHEKQGFRTAWVMDAIHNFLLDAMKEDKPDFNGLKEGWGPVLAGCSEAAAFL